jgi:hypothetical protein
MRETSSVDRPCVVPNQKEEATAMKQTVRAVFDGNVLRPLQPVDLQPDRTYLVTIDQPVPCQDTGADDTYPLTQIGRLAVDIGMTDFATRHSTYAHGCIEDEDRGA